VNSELRVAVPDDVIELIAQRVADMLEARNAARAAGPVGRWLTVADAAAYIGARPQRIYDLRSSGRLRRTGDSGRALVDRRELDVLIERGLL
jgi:Helix-turn-helix domain